MTKPVAAPAKSGAVIDFSGQQNTVLTPEEEMLFHAWKQVLAPNLQNEADYDLRGAWKADAKAAENGHLPDTFKKTNHMTFSNESIHATPAQPGGTWTEKPDKTWEYAAPLNVTSMHSPDDLLNYFQAFEQGNKVVLPKGTK